MVRNHPTSPLDEEPDRPLTFSETTTLAFLAVAAVASAVLIMLGTLSAEHRIVAVLGLG